VNRGRRRESIDEADTAGDYAGIAMTTSP
jgi:hypothetical protein